MTKFLLTQWLLLACLIGVAQEYPLPSNKEFQKAIGNETRQNDGKPGAKYWLNHAKYNIDVHFDPTEHKLTGTETIVYDNNSPNSLSQIVLAVYQDIMRKGSTIDWGIPYDHRNDGVTITQVKVNGKELDLKDKKQIRRKGTNRFITLPQPLLSGSKCTLQVSWHYTMLEKFNVRGGAFSNERFFLSYFFPKIAVYDDIDGWDTQSYTGYAEMYSDFSDYTLQVTVPDEFKVWGTGELTNAKELLATKYWKRLQKAKKSDKVVRIIRPEDLADNNQIKGTGEKKWIFTSKYVPDVAFAIGRKILWDGLTFIRDSKTKETLFLDAAYDSTSTDFYNITEASKATILDMVNNSVRWPFPYPQYTVFNGSGGMEFPMMCNNGSEETERSAVALAYHEIAHTYFPFYMGTNERKYAWMDEGWARLFPHDHQNKNYGDQYTAGTQKSYLEYAGSELEFPPITITYQIPLRNWYRQATYNKPHYAYRALRNHLGYDLFYTCMNEYMRRWNGKHPLPFDFFNTFDQISGQDLNWFWKSWFVDKNHPDLVVSVNKKNVTIENKGGLWVAPEIEITFVDGEKRTIKNKADFWKKGLTQHLNFQKEIQKVEVGGKHKLDTTPENNMWERK